MNWVKDLAQYISDLFKWWIVVLPWQEGIRIRAGKNETHMKPGMYLKLPIIDVCFVQNIRFRYTQLPIQTVTTKDEKTVTLTGTIGYEITDIRLLYNKISNPESTIVGVVMGQIAEYFATHDVVECSPSKIIDAVKMDTLSEMGMKGELKLSSFAVVKTFRLIQDGSWMPTAKEFEI